MSAVALEVGEGTQEEDVTWEKLKISGGILTFSLLPQTSGP